MPFSVIVEFVEGVAVLAFASIFLALLGWRLDLCRWPCQALVGVILGSAGVLSMASPVVVSPGLVFDARAVVAVLSAPFAGPLAAVVTAAMMSAMRMSVGGPGVIAGIASIALAAGIGLLFHAFLHGRGRRLEMKDLPFVAFACALVPVVSALFLPGWPMALEVLSTATPLSAATNFVGVWLLGVLVLWDRERRDANAALQESEARLRAIADNAPGVLYQRVMTPEGELSFRFVSDGAADILGVPARDIMDDAATALEMLPPKDLPRYEKSIEASAKTLAPWRFESRFRRPDGKLVWLLSQSTPRRGSGGETIWDGFVLDITERRQMEELLRAARRSAEEASAAKSRFLALVTHELRSPLTAISGYADLIRSEVYGPLGDRRYVAYVDTIKTASSHLAAVIDDLLDLSKVEAGKIELQPQLFEVAGVVGEVADILRVRAHAAGVILRTSVARPCAVRADPGRLRQVLLNLATNAIRFTPPGGQVRIAAVPAQEGGVRISVSDTGIGIAAADLQRVLKPFVQIDNEVNRKGGGTGLGLPLSKRLVELHGGALSIESALGTGTTVTVRLGGEPAHAVPGGRAGGAGKVAGGAADPVAGAFGL